METGCNNTDIRLVLCVAYVTEYYDDSCVQCRNLYWLMSVFLCLLQRHKGIKSREVGRRLVEGHLLNLFIIS